MMFTQLTYLRRTLWDENSWNILYKDWSLNQCICLKAISIQERGHVYAPKIAWVKTWKPDIDWKFIDYNPEKICKLITRCRYSGCWSEMWLADLGLWDHVVCSSSATYKWLLASLNPLVTAVSYNPKAIIIALFQVQSLHCLSPKGWCNYIHV